MTIDARPTLVGDAFVAEGFVAPTSSCGSAYVPRYSSIARCVLAVAMVTVPGAVGLVAGAHSQWEEPWAYLLPWAVMFFATFYGPIALRPPKDPIAAIVDDVREQRLDLDEGLRLIGVIHDRRTLWR